MDDTKKMHGWFSRKAHAISKNLITYETPQNTNVIVTNVTYSSTDSGTQWDDIIYLGEVTKFVSNKPTFLSAYRKNK